MTTTPFHGGASATDRNAEDLADQRRGWFRRLDLIHGGRTFLRRRGIDLRWFGLYLHRIDQADPGRDLHDHPWPFVSILLRGGYEEEWCVTRDAHRRSRIAEGFERQGFGYTPRGWSRRFGRWSVHRVPLTVAHRIVAADPGTVTLVLRGRKSQPWGFYMPDGWIDQRDYPYEKRRPVTETRS